MYHSKSLHLFHGVFLDLCQFCRGLEGCHSLQHCIKALLGVQDLPPNVSCQSGDWHCIHIPSVCHCIQPITCWSARGFFQHALRIESMELVSWVHAMHSQDPRKSTSFHCGSGIVASSLQNGRSECRLPSLALSLQRLSPQIGTASISAYMSPYWVCKATKKEQVYRLLPLDCLLTPPRQGPRDCDLLGLHRPDKKN